MTGKSGQISVFFVLGAVIIGVGFLIITTISDRYEVEEEPILSTDAQIVQNYVEACITSSATKAITYTSLQGGYNIIPDQLLFTFEGENAPYYFQRGSIFMPSMEVVEHEISELTEEFLDICLNGFSNLEAQGISVNAQTPTVTTTVRAEDVDVELDLSLTVERGGVVSTLDTFKVNLPDLRLGTMYNAVQEFILGHLEFGESICMSCLADLGAEHDLFFVAQYMDQGIYLFTVVDVREGASPLYFGFVNQYEQTSCTNLPDDAGYFYLKDCLEQQGVSTLSLQPIPDSVAQVGQLFTLPIDVTGTNLVFEVNADFFNPTDQQRVLSFTPTQQNVGTHTITIQVEDGAGNRALELFSLEVRE